MRVETWLFFAVAAAWVVIAATLGVFVNSEFFIYLGVFLVIWAVFGLGLFATARRRQHPRP